MTKFSKLTCASALAVLSSCGLTQAPQILAIEFRGLPFDQAKIDAAKAGDRTEFDALAATPCVVNVSFAPGVKPDFDQSGTPGQSGYNLMVTANNPTNFATRGIANCPPLEDLVFSMGGPSFNGGFGTETGGSFQFLIGGETYGNSRNADYFSGEFTSFAASTGTISGEFEAMVRHTSTTMFIVTVGFAGQ